jgi:hypothetical protein
VLAVMTITSSHAQTADGDANAAPMQPAPNHLADPGGSSAPIRDDPGVLPPGADPENKLFVPFVKHMAADQMQFWGSAKELTKAGALKTFVPFAGFTGMLIASDSWISKQVPNKPNQLQLSKDISNYAVYSLIGAAGGSYLWGHMTRNDRLSEAGFLSGEAALNSTLVAYAFKGITQRPRPYQDDGNGTFFQGGTSFPSEHAAVAWSVATVMAHEYPGILTQIAAYGLASTVTLTRVTSKQHFASDAFVGSVLGWYLGRQIYRAHHDPQLGGAPWGELVEAKEKAPRDPANMGSPYEPLDSWVYPEIERLAALGYVHSAYLGIRPWTRMECARLLDEAQERMRDRGADQDGEASKIYTVLAEEFSAETGRRNGAANLGASVDSVYSRFMEISGPPLRDGYHFGQTITNDYGRPYGEGFNNVTGASAHAVAGPFSFYVRGEYQQAGSVPALSQQALRAIASTDIRNFGPNFMPPGFSINTESVSRFRLLEGYAALTFHNVQFSVGKQSSWLGPGESGPLLMADNAEPIPMFRIDNTSPSDFPLLSRLLGPARIEFFIGQLSGLQWVFQPPTLYGPDVRPQPFIHGTKISFKPTPNLEFGAGFTSMFGGPGLPFTWANFLRTFYSHKSNLAENPGKRFSSFDFNYRIPGLRNWLTLYLDSLVVDEYSPIGSTRPSVNPGVYLPRLPRLPKLDMRVEGFKTDHPPASCCFPGSVYWDLRYNSGYTNNGNLLASWIGRAGYGGQAWSTYALSPRTKFQLGYRHQEVDHAFIGGGRLTDYSARSDVMLTREIGLSVFVQQERWNFPVLSTTAQSNFTASFQFTFYPH